MCISFDTQRPVTKSETDFETAMVYVENGYVSFHRETLICSCTQAGQGTRDKDLGPEERVQPGSEGLAAHLGEGTSRSYSPKADISPM